MLDDQQRASVLFAYDDEKQGRRRNRRRRTQIRLGQRKDPEVVADNEEDSIGSAPTERWNGTKAWSERSTSDRIH